MMKALIFIVALLLAGVDFFVTLLKPSERHQITQYGFGFDTPQMRDAWQRVKARPWSLLHEWVNLAVSYYEGPAQEGPVKVTGAVVLVLVFAVFVI